MEEDQNGRWPKWKSKWKMRQMEDERMQDDPNGRRQMENDQIEDDWNGRQPNIDLYKIKIIVCGKNQVDKNST